jgi:hypothetical protein
MDLHSWITLVEAHHAYDDIDYKTKFQPFKRGDTVRVFHGFHSLSEALTAAKTGLSGRDRADRRYSYEHDNNPHGLFVTLKIDVAKDFTDRGAIMEFNASLDDLEAPLWPSGGYTVQGQMAQYFGHGATGRANRRAKHRAMTAQTAELVARDPEYLGHVEQSDDPHRAFMLSTASEYQSLFVGHLDPAAITAFWVPDQSGKAGRYAEWSRMSREQFLESHSNVEIKTSRRMFSPNEPFDGTEFIRRMDSKYKLDLVERMFRNAFAEIRSSPNAGHRFQQLFNLYLWPKQYVPALRWLVRTYGKLDQRPTEAEQHVETI